MLKLPRGNLAQHWIAVKRWHLLVICVAYCSSGETHGGQLRLVVQAGRLLELQVSCFQRLHRESSKFFRRPGLDTEVVLRLLKVFEEVTVRQGSAISVLALWVVHGPESPLFSKF
eukprot:Skav219177  [mRNA]  locus=scaffold648:446485:453433:+ [translate_table: standard]